MPKSRPEHVCCIADTQQDRIGLSLCGEQIGSSKEVPFVDPVLKTPLGTIKELVPAVFCFMSIDHWFQNARAQRYLLGCPECLAKISEQLGDEDEALGDVDV